MKLEQINYHMAKKCKKQEFVVSYSNLHESTKNIFELQSFTAVSVSNNRTNEIKFSFSHEHLWYLVLMAVY